MPTVKALIANCVTQFDADAQVWNVQRLTARLIAVAPIILVGIVTVLAALAIDASSPFRAVFRWVTDEDSLLEWPQFFCVFAASLMFGGIGLTLIRRRQYGMGLLYLLLLLATLFVAGEEISWGQRVFGWGTPEALAEVNHQNETNVHNIRWVQTAFGYVVFLGGMYGALAPVLHSILQRDRSPSTTVFLTIPPLFLVPAFLMPFAYRFFRVFIWPDTHFIVVTYGEAPELCLYFGLVVFAWLNLRRLRYATGVSVNHVTLPSAP
jgi:hypothetical protein